MYFTLERYIYLLVANKKERKSYIAVRQTIPFHKVIIGIKRNT